MGLGNRIRKLRFEKGEMTQQQLADLIGTSRMTVYSIETGRFVPSTLLALKIAKVFGKPVEEIFFILEEKHDRRKKR
ncbi:MAG: helix-turn-helix transcriptional regulator [Anaerolineales bacterium]